MNNVHFLSGNKAMNQTNNITMKKPLNEPKVNPRDRFIIWLPCDNNARLNILVNILEMIKVDMNSKVNEKVVITQSSIKTIWLNLFEKEFVLDIETIIDSTRPINLPSSSINPLLNPL